MSVKLLGGLLLVGSMAVLAQKERHRLTVTLSALRAWRRFLSGAQQEIVSAGASLSVVLAPLWQDAVLQRELTGGRQLSGGTQSTRALFEMLCCSGAALLPASDRAAGMLRNLSEAFDRAYDASQIGERIEELLAALASLQERLEDGGLRECRARAALYICGALCAVLMLW